MLNYTNDIFFMSGVFQKLARQAKLIIFTFLPGGAKQALPARRPGKYRISDILFPVRSRGSGGREPAGAPRPAAEIPAHPQRRNAAFRGTVLPS